MASKKKKKISIFANIIISVSISVGLFMTLITLIEYWVLRIPIPSDVLAVLIGFWGGICKAYSDFPCKENNESEDLP